MKDLLPRKFHKDPLRNEGALVFSDFSRHDFVEHYLKPAGMQSVIVDVIDESDGIYYYRLQAGGEVFTGWVEIMRGAKP